MKDAHYASLIAYFKKHQILKGPSRGEEEEEQQHNVIAQQLSISLDAYLSCRHQWLVRQVKMTSTEHRRNISFYCERYKDGQGIYQLACQVGFPPYLLARMMVEEMCCLPRAKVSDVMKCPSTFITDTRLRNEVEFCIDKDRDFSPGADRVARSIGSGYERELCLRLRAMGIPFEDEEALRARGLPKTPDVRLLVPCGCINPKDGKQYIINWIDSKAMFGTRETHLNDLLPQVTRYVNRFGPGCVIFWCGFLDSLGTQSKHVLLLDHLPQALITLPGI